MSNTLEFKELPSAWTGFLRAALARGTGLKPGQSIPPIVARCRGVVAGAEALPFGDGEFDVVMSAIGVMFAPHHQAAAGLTHQRAARLPEHAIVMHPGPINRGVEIEGDMAYGARSVILEQVNNGIAVRMAVMDRILGARP